MVVGRQHSFCHGNFVGVMLNFGVYFIRHHKAMKQKYSKIDPSTLNHSKDVNEISQATFFFSLLRCTLERFYGYGEVGICPSKMSCLRPVELR